MEESDSTSNRDTSLKRRAVKKKKNDQENSVEEETEENDEKPYRKNSAEAAQTGQEKGQDQKGVGCINEGFDDNMEYSEYMKWVKTQFNCKVCKIFVASKTDSDLCCCGRPKSFHPSAKRLTTWSSKHNTVKEPTDSIGMIQFAKCDQSQTTLKGHAEYIRLADDTPQEKIAQLVYDVWGLKDPQILISVIGGHSSATLSDELKSAVENGISKVLKSADVWLMTGGSAIGYSKTMAEVFQNAGKKDRLHKNACIGVIPWGCTDQKLALVNDGGMVKLPVPQEDTAKEDGKKKLDHNHTHFMLVDNGSLEGHEFQHKFRIHVQRFLIERHGRSLPSIAILVEGGLSSVSALHAALKSSPQIPVMVVQGSGRVADLIGDVYIAYQNLSEQQKRRGGLTIFKDLHRKLAEVLNEKPNPAEVSKAARFLQECIEDFNDKIIIYDIKKEEMGLHQALLQACKAGKSGQTQDAMFNQLQLAMLWDDLDAAKAEFSSEIEDRSLHKMLKRSLIAGKIDIVKVIINQKKVDMNEFLTMEVLKKLYMKKLKDGRSTLLKLLTKQEKHQFVNDKSFGLETVDRLLYLLLDEHYTPCYSRLYLRERIISPVQELLIWSTLSNERDTTEKLLRLEENYLLPNCLMLAKLYRAISERISDQDEVKAMQYVGKSYADMAISVLTSYYKYDAESAVLYIEECIPLFGNSDLITLAADMAFMAFVAHPCCQRVLDEKWSGKGLNSKESWEEKVKMAYQQKPRRLSDLNRYAESASIKPGKGLCKRVSNLMRLNIAWLLLVPKGKLALHVFIYAIFLALYSYDVMIFKDAAKDVIEWLLLAYVIGLTLDEIRQVAEVRKKSNWDKIKGWAESIWNLFDFASLALFLSGFITRFHHQEHGNVVMSAALAIFYLKVFQFYRPNRILGPYVVMIFKMFRHLLAFLLVLVVGMLAFGVFFTSILHTNNGRSWKVLFNVLYRPFFIIFGELNLENTLLPNKTVFGTAKVNEGYEVALVIALCIYLLFATVLLINLLIAIFNNIYEKIHKNSHEIWKFEKYDMLQEFCHKPYLPNPFSVFENIFRLTRLAIHTCKKHKSRRDTALLEMQSELLDFERKCVRNYWKELDSKKSISVEKYVVEITSRLAQQSLTFEENQAKIEARLEAMEHLIQRLVIANDSKEQSVVFQAMPKKTLYRRQQVIIR